MDELKKRNRRTAWVLFLLAIICFAGFCIKTGLGS